MPCWSSIRTNVGAWVLYSNRQGGTQFPEKLAGFDSRPRRAPFNINHTWLSYKQLQRHILFGHIADTPRYFRHCLIHKVRCGVVGRCPPWPGIETCQFFWKPRGWLSRQWANFNPDELVSSATFPTQQGSNSKSHTSQFLLDIFLPNIILSFVVNA